MSAFQQIAEGRSGSLVKAALEFARDEYPYVDVAGFAERIRELNAGFELYRAVQADHPTSPHGILNALNQYFFGELGFRGSTEDYYDPRNSYLNDVIERRVGIPISLSVLYREIAGSAGLELCGVNLPGHFVLAYPPRLGMRTYVDVFGGGQCLDWKGCCERLRLAAGKSVLRESEFPPMSDRDVLVRMLRNLKGIYSNTDACRALRVQERLVALLPDEPAEQRDLGLLYYRNGRPIIALKTLQELVRRHPKMGEVEFIRDSLRQAAREAALVN
jgi:regulator of sirC expression with transglutaminase-like and TPR domain